MYFSAQSFQRSTAIRTELERLRRNEPRFVPFGGSSSFRSRQREGKVDDMVIRDGKERHMAKPGRRVTDAVCALSKMDSDMIAQTVERLRAKSPEAADMLKKALS